MADDLAVILGRDMEVTERISTSSMIIIKLTILIKVVTFIITRQLASTIHAIVRTLCVHHTQCAVLCLPLINYGVLLILRFLLDEGTLARADAASMPDLEHLSVT